MGSSHKKKGFTLIELLVVVAIIVVLVAMLLPALSKARNQAKTILCGSRLNQMHLACVQYAADFNGCQPLTVIWPPPTPVYNERWNWTLVGLKYLPNSLTVTSPPPSGWYYNSEVLYCPSEPTTVGSFTFRSIYGRNAFLGDSFQLDKVNNPSLKIFIGDSSDGLSGFVIGYLPNGPIWQWAQYHSDQWNGRSNACHSGFRANFLYSDGHVGSISMEERPDTNFGWIAWNGDWLPYF